MTEQQSKRKYVPDMELREIFADAVTSVGYDGANIRLELSVGRIVHNAGGQESTVHPVARLVVPLSGINELMQKLGGALGDLEKQGVLRKGAPPSAPVRN